MSARGVLLSATILGSGAVPVIAQAEFTPQDNPHPVPNNKWLVYTANGAVDHLTLETAHHATAADGHSLRHIVVHVFGENGKPVSGDTYVTIELSGEGRLVLDGTGAGGAKNALPDLDRATPGTQVRVTNGVLAFDIAAPNTPQIATLRVTAGFASAETKLMFTPELRPLFAIGILEGVISKQRLNPAATHVNDGFERDLQNWSKHFADGSSVSGRAAFFAKGQIAPDTSITVAYDSEKPIGTQLMRDISPELYYPVMGDASTTGFDARSSQRGYLRIDHKQSYALYGDFDTGDGFSQASGGGDVAGLQTRKLGAYNRTLNGIRLHAETSHLTANAFASYDRLRQTTEQYALNGTSILPFATRADAVLGSEKVEIITYDKSVRTVMLSILPLERYKDYAFEPFNGRIRLLGGDVNFTDSNGNLRYIRVTYETSQPTGARYWAYGADAQLKITHQIEIGGSYVKDTNPLAPYTLASVNATVKLGPKTTVVAEVARSQSEGFIESDGSTSSFSTGAVGEAAATLSGTAYRIEVAHESKALHIQASYEHVAPGFTNPSIGTASGQATLNVKANVKLSPQLSAYADVSRVQDLVTVGNPKRDSEEVGVHWQANKGLTLSVALHHIHEDAGLASQTSLPGNYGGLINPAGLTLSGVSFGNPGLTNIINTAPLNTVTARLGISYKLTPRLTLSADAEHALADARHNRFAFGAEYQLAERTKLYARYEAQTGLGSGLSLNQGDRSSALVAGVSSSYANGSEVYTEYRLRDAMSDQNLRTYDMQLASGVRNAWHIADGLSASTNVEYLRIFNGNARDALGLGAGLDYTGSPNWKGSLRAEWRRIFDDPNAPGNQTEDQYLLTASVARKLSSSWTLLARNYLLLNRYHDDASGAPIGNIFQDRAQIGAAWRPTGDDRLNALFRYDYKVERDHSTAAGVNYNAQIASINVNWHPARSITFDARLAGEKRSDIVPDATTGGTQKSSYTAGLASGRIIFDLSRHIDVSVMGAVLRSNGSSQYAQGTEAGYLLGKNMWLSAGYNWTGFDSADLSGNDYHTRGAYLRLRIKFSGTVFGP